MMRYKGARIDNGEEVKGFHFHDKQENKSFILDKDFVIHHLRDNNFQPTIIGMIEVHPDSVGQMTGKQDENKKDIYNGDEVFLCGFDIRGKVYYCEISCCYRIECKELDTALCKHRVFIIEKEK